ncbi:MAG: hypothetical protein IJ883_04620 [Eubacterium sp.]|nr:hypothetical protein [Eubacterium sp.]
MSDDLFGDMFDLDNDGEIDDIEKAAEIGFMSESFDEDEYDDEDLDEDEDDEY